MEYLNRLLKNLKQADGFKFHPKSVVLQVVELGFAYDLMLFCRGDLNSVKVVLDCFQKFSQASGLIANLSKKCTYYIGGCSYMQDVMEYMRKEGEIMSKWLHAYHEKGRIIWEANPKQASWMVQQIFKAKYLVDAGYTFSELQSMAAIWERLLQWQGIRKQALDWEAECNTLQRDGCHCSSIQDDTGWKHLLYMALKK
ncbi:uncharacterized protein LOC142164321 [Nicotiana tabacum]|uniref:Uncharacterized protein LOC142164321 n=1 Tax=Nicotiana tabacum TaxID=4097 RepID=A0AC58S095_TOBAC